MSEPDFGMIEEGAHIGVSGSIYGGTPEALRSLHFMIDQCQALGARYLHQGCCTGWDEQSIPFAQRAGLTVVGHPPTDPRYLSHEAVAASEILWTAKPYHARDADIAFETAVLLIGPAYPENDERARRSGTWLTARLSRRYGGRVYACTTDGDIVDVTESR